MFLSRVVSNITRSLIHISFSVAHFSSVSFSELLLSQSFCVSSFCFLWPFSAQVSSFRGSFPPVLQCWFRLQTFNLVLSITWLAPQSALLDALVSNTSITSLCLTMMSSNKCQCLDLGCIYVILYASLYLNRVLVTTRLYSEHSASRSSPLALHLPTPWLPSTPLHFSVSEPTLPLKSPTSISLSSDGISLIFSRRSPWNYSFTSSVLVIVEAYTLRKVAYIL